VRGVGLHQSGVEMMLADDLAEPVTYFGTTIISVSGLWWELLRLLRWPLRFSRRSEFFDGADSDPISLAESTIDCPSFCDSHLGAVDERRHIGRISVTVSVESSARLRGIYLCPKREARQAAIPIF